MGMTQDALAAAGGVQRRAQANYEAGERVPDASYLAGVAAAGLDVLYVITGQRQAKARAPAHLPAPTAAEPPPKWRSPQASSLDPVSPDTTQSGAPLMGGFPVTNGGVLLVPAASSHRPPLRLPVAFDGGQVSREFQVIPRYKATASAGNGDVQRDDAMGVDAAGVLAMDRTFMREQLGSDKPGFVTVAVKGDSMERTLIDGETIIIDSDVNEVDCNGIYVVQVGKALLVKRLILGMDGSVLVKSDNPAYASYDREFSAEQATKIRVVGRMVWPKFR